MHKTAIAFAIKHHINLGRVGDNTIYRQWICSKITSPFEKNLYYITEKGYIVACSHNTSTYAAICMMKKYLRSK